MSPEEATILVLLLKKRKQELQNDLDTKDYSNVLSVKESKLNQIEAINLILVQL